MKAFEFAIMMLKKGLFYKTYRTILKDVSTSFFNILFTAVNLRRQYQKYVVG